MLMANIDTNKANDTDGSDQRPDISGDRCFVKLRNKCRYYRLLANWCCDSRRQEDSEPWMETGSNIRSGFSSRVNNKAHRRSYNLSNNLCRDKNKKAKRSSSNTNTQRNDGLSYFVRTTEEQLKKNHKDSYEENTQKFRKQSTATAISAASTGKLFTTRGRGETIFGFKHFAKPEDVLTEYINAYIYKRTRLEKVDKKKISDWIIEVENTFKDTSIQSNEPRAENTFRGDQFGTKVLKLGKRSPMTKFTAQRITATSNFVFELGALDVTNLRIDQTHEIPTIEGIRAERRTAFNAEENTRNLINDKKGYLDRLQKSISLLPKLSSAELLRADGIDNSESKTSVARKTVLPNINPRKSTSGGKNKVQKSLGIRNKRSDQVDKNAAVSKSNWQILKQKRNLMHRKDCNDSWQRKKLCDTLEKISSKIYNEQFSYLGSKADDYREKGANETLGRDDRRTEVRKSLVSKVFDSSLKDAVTANRSDKNSSKGRVFTIEKKEKFTDEKCGIDKCLDKHSRALFEEMSNGDREEEIVNPNLKVVADLLAKLDIHDVGFYIDSKKEKSVNAATSPKKSGNSKKELVDDKLNSINSCGMVIRTGEKLLERFVVAECGRSVSDPRGIETSVNESALFEKSKESLSTDKQSCGESQTDRIIVQNNSAFIEIGLKGLEDRIPKHLGTQILKSNFLKKELSFKPANICQTYGNFNNLLNSGWNLASGVENSGSDMSQQDKCLEQKIQRTMANSTNDGEPAKMINKFKVDKNYQKLCKIIEEKFTERKDKINCGETMRHSFAKKFLNIQTEILQNPRLQAVLPGFLDGIKNLAEMRAR